MADPAQTLLDSARDKDTLVLRLRGEWDIREKPPGFGELAPQFRNGSSPTRVTSLISERPV